MTSTATHTERADPREEIRRALRVLIEPGAVHELRILNVPGASVVSGYFDDLDAMAAAAAHYDGRAEGVYITANPVLPALLARAENRVKERAGKTTGDDQVTRRRWLLIDVDWKRPSGISTTDAEHEAAIERAHEIARYLGADLDWSGPVIADSGNGAHVLARIDLPNDRQSTELVSRALAALAFQFSDDAIVIDESVSNPARIWKAYGTMACKGDSIAERPHRRAKLLYVPDVLEVVPREKLEALAALAPKAEPKRERGTNGSGQPFDVAGFLSRNGIPVLRSGPWKDGTRWVLEQCPFAEHSTPGKPYIVQMASGALAAGCHSGKCSWTWHDLRARYEPQTGEHGARGNGATYSEADDLGPGGPEPLPRVRVGDDLAERLTDLGNARRLVRLHGADLRYRHDAGAWLVWDGRRWAPDTTGEVVRRAKATVATIYAEAAQASSDAERKEVARWGARAEARERIAAMIDLARSELGIPVRAEELDQDAYALNVLNGTLDLRWGVLRAHRREDMLTKLAPVEYEPGARSERWEGFLETAIPDSEARRFAQKAAGYSLLGRTGDDVFLVVHGPPRTGKGTFQNALAATLGEYATTAGLQDFAERRHGAGSEARPELVRLQGSRVVNIYETSRRLQLEAALVKTLTGSDPILARDLYAKPIEFLPQFTLWIATNHRPRVPDDDAAIWERVRELPFTTVIGEEKRKREVRAELTDPKASGAAVLAWAVEGCRLYLAEGLQAPELVRKATADYRAEMDPLREFFAACCVFGPALWVSSAALAASYEAWGKESGEKRVTDFNDRLRARGCEPDRRHLGRGWKGLGLLEPARSVTP